ncbi:amidohydrolase family protein [Candidimonas humi]|uniref:Amidohydrolase family protein n=1 Tax=Candidimonas humi TaxID=683355 RepID=A0ABV8NW44_9BURK|nr:amidohydrolase family protein [Candidimonas humi]MBV6305840.1 amidohydrolase family protein [Candidimonas humi]
MTHASRASQPAAAGPGELAPDGACDAHIHIYDKRYPSQAHGLQPPRFLGVPAYLELRRRLNLQRTVVVTPGIYGTDNRVTLQAISDLGPESARGVAVLHPDVAEAELDVLHAGGIRGVRFTLFNPKTAVTGFDMIEPMAQRIQRLGWHVQLHLTAQQIVEHAALLERLPGTLVFDHMLRLPKGAGPDHPALDIVAGLLARGNTWVKLSGAYLNSQRADYADTVPVAQALTALAPRRMVWGSDWPHPTESGAGPDDTALFALLGQWVPDTAARRRVLVDNPAELYGF